MNNINNELIFVSCISRLDVARDCLLASPCLQPGGRPLVMYWNSTSAALAMNTFLDSQPSHQWVVWVHQDVRLPLGWDIAFLAAITKAQAQWDQLAVVGLYGITGAGPLARRAGHVIDRGNLLKESEKLPCSVDSMDELLFAVRGNTPLRLDADLCYDFYATDLVLQAQDAGFTSVVVDVCCEHWSDTPQVGPIAESLAKRIAASAEVFEKKWAHRLPLSTPCFEIFRPGDVKEYIKSFEIV